MDKSAGVTLADDALLRALEKTDIREAISSASPSIVRRFRQGVKVANPQIRDDQLDVYTEAFAREVDGLSELILSKYIAALSASVSERELEAFCDLVEHPGIRTLIDILERHSFSLTCAVQKVMRQEGAATHREGRMAAAKLRS